MDPLRLQDRRERWFDGTLTEVGFEGDEAALCAIFPLLDGPLLEIAETVRLVLDGSGKDPQRIPARVVYQARDPQNFRYRFVVGVEATPLVTPALNRRNALRVRPLADQPVEASIRTADGRVQAVVNDISVTGISLLFGPEEEKRLFESWNVPLSLRFPDRKEPLELLAFIRYRRLSGAAIFYGIEFDKEGTEFFEAKLQVIRRYVSRRQIDEIARARGRGGGKER